MREEQTDVEVSLDQIVTLLASVAVSLRALALATASVDTMDAAYDQVENEREA